MTSSLPHPDAADESNDDQAAAIRTIASEQFGWDELRPGLADAIGALVSGGDVLGVMPTGYGKSAVYQVAGAMLKGITVVISPLIALQDDQVRSITAAPGAAPAAAIHSGRSHAELTATWTAVENGELEYLFLAPEQLANENTVRRLAAAGVGLVAVDEAHCVSSWGHDFRPDYLGLAGVIDEFGHPPVVALTATGAAPVRDEIVERLRLREPLILARGFDRANIRLEVARFTDARDKRRSLIEHVAAQRTDGRGGTGLVYVATRRRTNEIAEALAATGMRAGAYHGALSTSEREDVHERFISGDLDVVVATSAFGMGIDKPDVRYVVHLDVPDSLESYYQEIGRAGRDGESAVGMLFYRSEDLGLRSFFASGGPSRTAVGDVFRAIDAEPGISRSAVATALDRSARTITGIVNLLVETGSVVSRSRGLHPADGATADGAVADAVEAVESRERIDRSRIDMMRAYAETRECRRKHLLGYFGEEYDEPCGNCDICLSERSPHESGATAETDTSSVDDDRPFPDESTVVHPLWGEGTVMTGDDETVTVFFESEGYKVLSLADVEERGLLALATA